MANVSAHEGNATITQEQYQEYTMMKQMMYRASISNVIANLAVGGIGHVQLPTEDSAKISHIGDCTLTGGSLN
ncbi:hypothetical protein P3L10_017914 [Capsicum annuum]